MPFPNLYDFFFWNFNMENIHEDISKFSFAMFRTTQGRVNTSAFHFAVNYPFKSHQWIQSLQNSETLNPSRSLQYFMNSQTLQFNQR